MIFICIRPEGPQWPYSLAQLRTDHPNVSFSADPSAEDLAPFSVFPVQPTDPPQHDTASFQAREVMPVQADDGTWRQAWVLDPIDPPAPPQPGPDWLGFAGWLYGFAPMMDAMNAARASHDPQGEPATTGLPAALQEARAGNVVAFALSWAQFLAASSMDEANLAEIVAKASLCRLPPEFISALQP